MGSEYLEKVDNEALLTAIVSQLRSESDDLAQRSVVKIREDFPSYEVITDEELQESVIINVRRATEAILHGIPPDPQDAENRLVPAHRMRRGVPISDIIGAYRVSISKIHDRFLAIARQRDLDAGQIVRALPILWELGDWYTRGVSSEYHHFVAQVEARDAVARSEIMRQIMDSSLRPGGFLSMLRRAGLDPESDYFVMVRRHGPFEDSDDTLDAKLPVSSQHRFPEGAFVAVMGSWEVALIPARHANSSLTLDALWSKGPIVPLLRAQESLSAAEAIVNALPADATGVYSTSDVGWRLVFPLHNSLRMYLYETYIEPIKATGGIAVDLFETLSSYLNHALNVRRTAQALHVHENTVRYRLDRCERLWGRSLEDKSSIVELALALEMDV